MHKTKLQGRYLFVFVAHSVRNLNHQPEIIYCYARTEKEAIQYAHRKVGKFVSVRMMACIRRRSGWHSIQHFTDNHSLVLVASCFGMAERNGATENALEARSGIFVDSQGKETRESKKENQHCAEGAKAAKEQEAAK